MNRYIVLKKNACSNLHVVLFVSHIYYTYMYMRCIRTTQKRFLGNIRIYFIRFN